MRLFADELVELEPTLPAEIAELAAEGNSRGSILHALRGYSNPRTFKAVCLLVDAELAHRCRVCGTELIEGAGGVWYCPNNGCGEGW